MPNANAKLDARCCHCGAEFTITVEDVQFPGPYGVGPFRPGRKRLVHCARCSKGMMMADESVDRFLGEIWDSTPFRQAELAALRRHRRLCRSALTLVLLVAYTACVVAVTLGVVTPASEPVVVCW